jgi:hypothetical protein
MRHIKKYMTGFAAAGLVMTIAGVSQAFTHQQSFTATAAATVTGGSAAMSVAVIGGSQITWSATAGGPWTMANEYLQITSTLTSAGSGIQTYTQNSGGLYTGKASSTTAAGLVNLQTPTQTIPMAWQVSTGTPVAADDPNNTGVGHTGYAWFYYADLGGGLLPFAPGNSYIQVENQGNPPQIQYADTVPPSFGGGASNGINKLYLEANFANAVAGTYQTSTLTLELFTQ